MKLKPTKRESKNLIRYGTKIALKPRKGEGVGLGVHSSSQSLSLSLGKELTIFQAEVSAIWKCEEDFLANQTKNQNILMCSDSESSLKALKKDMIN